MTIEELIDDLENEARRYGMYVEASRHAAGIAAGLLSNAQAESWNECQLRRTALIDRIREVAPDQVREAEEAGE